MWSYGVHLCQHQHHHHHHHHFVLKHQSTQRIACLLYAELLGYSPAIVEQPLPTDSILVPKECMFDIKLRCPPDVGIIRIPVLQQAICSLQDHLPPNIEEDYRQIINTSPECINICSDSDVACLD